MWWAELYNGIHSATFETWGTTMVWLSVQRQYTRVHHVSLKFQWPVARNYSTQMSSLLDGAFFLFLASQLCHRRHPVRSANCRGSYDDDEERDVVAESTFIRQMHVASNEERSFLEKERKEKNRKPPSQFSRFQYSQTVTAPSGAQSTESS